MKILIISLSGAGDVLMATPLIRELRLNFQNSKIDVLVMQGQLTKELLKDNPDINKIIYFNFMKEGVLKSLEFCRKLKKENYDLSITTYPQARMHYSIVTWLIHAKKRIGFVYETQKLNLNNLFFNNLIKEDFKQHVVENNLKVLKVMGLGAKFKPRLVLNLTKEDMDYAEQYFKKNGIKKAVVIHPGSGTTKNFILKRWGKDKFVELCRRIKDRKIILIGGEDEKELRDYIIRKSGLEKNKEIFSLSEDIKKEAAIIKKSGIVISNDSIIGHLAASVSAKVVGIFGPTSWENTGPFTEDKIIICKRTTNPYQHGSKAITREQVESLNKITVEDVYDAYQKSRAR